MGFESGSPAFNTPNRKPPAGPAAIPLTTTCQPSLRNRILLDLRFPSRLSTLQPTDLHSPSTCATFVPANNHTMTTLKEGDKAPAFKATTQGGQTVKLSDFKGRFVVLFFYPKDDTPGCTKEACAFRDDYAEFEKLNAAVLGVSVDPVKSHDKFAEKFNLPFPLLSDTDHAIVQAYGVWGEKSFMGRKYQGTHRVTFLISPTGRIQNIWPKVKPAEHAKEILAALNELSS